jgi:hypothetical protein
LLGCADEATQGGGQGEGIMPSKIAFVPPEPKPFDPATDVVALKQKLGSAPADAICDGCVVTSYKLVDNSFGLDEVRLVSDGGLLICKIFLNQDGVVIDECGWSRP